LSDERPVSGGTDAQVDGFKLRNYDNTNALLHNYSRLENIFANKQKASTLCNSNVTATERLV